MASKAFLLLFLGLALCGKWAHGIKSDCPFAKRLKETVSKHGDTTLKTNEEADPETTTPNGCTCTSECGATVDGDNYAYDWCYTNEDCGEHSIVYGWWDKCLYLDSSKPDYLALGWEEKQAQMWANIVADNSIGPGPNPLGILTESVKTTFDDEWDNMPVGRVKYIHPAGVVCPFNVNIMDSPFTGLFSNGETHGMIRLGSAAAVSLSSGVIPGGGVKFFRSGRSSANFVILNQLGPIADSNYNFFSVPMSNVIPEDTPIPLIPVALKFCQAQDCPTKVGISDVCKYDQEGNEVENLVFPYKVTFVPTGEVNFREDPSEVTEFYQQFDDIAVGTSVYELRGYQNPDDVEGVVIGNIMTTDKCVTSLYGDTKMFFKHQYIAEDKALRPEWAAAYEAGCTPYC